MLNLPASADDDSQWVAQARSQLQHVAHAHAARFDAGEPVDTLLQARSRAVDALIVQAWQRCFGTDTPDDIALFAVGGYGRGHLYPYSDIDLMLLAEPLAQQTHAQALARFIALLWDGGLRVSHAVRSLQQTVQAAEDLTVMTSLLEARLLAGNAQLLTQLQGCLNAAQLWPARAYFIAKREELRQRHARFGDTADNLEPHLKDGPGGLRDVQTLRWMALRVARLRDLESLSALGQMGADEYATVLRERQQIARLRYGLHLLANKPEDRLRFDYQKALAQRLGFVDAPGALAVEQMMQGFYRSAALVLRIGERLLQRFEEQLEGESVPAPLADTRFAKQRGYLSAQQPNWPQSVDDVFALFACWAEQPQLQGLHSQTARALAEFLPQIASFEHADASTRQAFLQLLRGEQAVRSIERMARLGVLGRWLPAFAKVSGRMQFDLFHVYTVDQHTLRVLHYIDGFARTPPDLRFAIAHTVWPQLRKPELLLLAGLFHDIGKGRGGDHAVLGAVDARQFCQCLGLPAADVDLVEWLVAQHLLMSTTAQKQDISDPDVIYQFARCVADRQRLDYLYLLTCADIAGTSPKLWNAWKDRLLADLYTATRLALRRGLENPVAQAERIAETRQASAALLQAQGMDAAQAERLLLSMPQESFLRSRAEQIAWQLSVLAQAPHSHCHVGVRSLPNDGAGGLEVFVHCPDREGLFAALVATLDRAGLAIQHARLLDGANSTVFDSFQVLPIHPERPVMPAQVQQQLEKVLQMPSLTSVRPPRRTQPRHLQHFRIRPQLQLDRSADGKRTVMSLVCTDQPGLLAQLAQVLLQQRLNVHDARIATFGERAEDVFQLTDANTKALDEAAMQALRDALLQVLSTASSNSSTN